MGVAVQEMRASALMEPFSEDGNKKTRKPYTITKSRESWTEQEHDKFLEALQLFDRDWKKIEAFVGSKTVIQIRSHAQKYFLKVQKNGTREHVPPPRPKRKATHPYPQKALKNGCSYYTIFRLSVVVVLNFSKCMLYLQKVAAYTLSQAATPFPASLCLLESEYTVASSSLSMLRSSSSSGTRSSWADGSIQPVTTSYTIKEYTEFSEDIRPPPACCSNTDSPRKTWQKSETDDRALPDFTRVYNFIGSIFDPNTGDHLQTLKEMDPIDVEAVVVLMRNISINLSSPDFEDGKKLLSSYNISG